jgi:hypothetical protein
MVAHNFKPRSSANNIQLGVIVGLVLLIGVLLTLRTISFNQKNQKVDTGGSSSFQLYQNSRYHFSIRFPQNWQVQTATTDADIVTLSSYQMQIQGAGGNMLLNNSVLPLAMSKIDIMMYDVDAGTTAQDLMSMQTGAVNAEQANLNTWNLGGQAALKMSVPTAANLLEGNESSATYTTLYITKGNHGYIIAGYAEPAIFDQIVNSAKFD